MLTMSRSVLTEIHWADLLMELIARLNSPELIIVWRLLSFSMSSFLTTVGAVAKSAAKSAVATTKKVAKHLNKPPTEVKCKGFLIRS